MSVHDALLREAADRRVSVDDLAAIGAATLNLVAASQALGHNGPHLSLCYVDREALPDWQARLVHDIFQMDSYVNDAPYRAARDRVQEFLTDTGWASLIAEQVSKVQQP